MARKEKEKHYNFAKRRYCGVKCKRLAQRIKVEARDCEECGEALVRKEKEKHCEFAKRRFCGHKCYRLSYRKIVTVLGVEITRAELTEMAGMSEGCIRGRIRYGRNLFTGKKE